MKNQFVIDDLRNIIYQKLYPFIGSDYVLLDVPYHGNIGDVLIWQGERDFLSTIPYRMLYQSSYKWPMKNLDKNTTILLHGGGNFGDIWREFQKFRLSVIEKYSDNPIVMFPQSVWYDDESLIKEDASRMARHKNLTLCARDNWSYDFMKKYFSANNILLVPDMAFCISDEFLNRYRILGSNKSLFIRRLDKEITFDTPTLDMDVRDWPTVETELKKITNLGYAFSIARRFPKPISGILYGMIDTFADSVIRMSLPRIGCEFLSVYDKIITTRLHAMILSVLLYKKVEYIDNVSKKLSAFAETWLSELETVKPYTE